MPRILIAECKQEVSTFNPHHSRYDDFRVRKGSAIINHHRVVRNEIRGALSVFDSHSDIDLMPTYSAMFITSAGMLEANEWNRIAYEFIDGIRNSQPCHGVYLSMHGAMACENEFDPEGYLIAETRKIVGEKIPIVVSLDLHGIVTDRMIEHSDAVVGYHTYPHVDFFETGQRSARLLLDIISGDVRPATAKVAIPALVRGDELITETGLLGGIIECAKDIEKSDGGLSAGLFIGNPFTDVPDLQTYSVVVTDNDPERAAMEALRLANRFWSHHHKMRMHLVSLKEMSQIARNASTGTLGLVDAADATSSGASGDSVALLHQLIEDGYQGRILAPVVDAEAVTAAIQVGVGGVVVTSVGGSLDTRFKCLPLQARVRLLSDGFFISESFGDYWVSGPTAVLEMDNLTLVVSSRAVNLYDRSFFYAHGQNPKNFDAVIIKAPHCEGRMYSDWCSRMVYVDAPGSTSANLSSLGHTRCPRPIFPLDKDVEFKPRAKLFDRMKDRKKDRADS